MDRRIVCWFSCGAASAVTTKIVLKTQPSNVDIVYCDTGSEHPDNKRFLKDCERWFGREVTILKSEKYKDTWDVWEQRKYLNGVHGAPCTTELKMQPRLAYQRPDDVHVFGYTYDLRDAARAVRLKKNFFELDIQTPLIANRITKEGCLAILKKQDIAIPVKYKQGFQNNNCIPCVKSESPSYWSMIRALYPNEYERMKKLDRTYGNGLVVYKGKRIHLDELPENIKQQKPIATRCDFMCGSLELDE